MAEEKIDGEVSQPSSQNGDKYADYYEMNVDSAEDTGNIEATETVVEDKPVDKKPTEPKEPVAEELSTEEKPTHVPNWKKKIDKQTKRIAELQEELKKLKEGNGGQQKPKYTRDNFVNDEEYEEWRDKSVTQRIRDELKQEMLESEMRRMEEERRRDEDDGFRESWAKKVKANYDVNSKEYQEYLTIAQDSAYLNSLPQAVHDYVEGTDFGPLMIHVLKYRPDLIEAIAHSKPIVQTRTLMRLESEIEAAYKGKQAEQKPTEQTKKVSSAPAPIGNVGVSGSTTSEDEDDATAYAKYIKQNLRR